MPQNKKKRNIVSIEMTDKQAALPLFSEEQWEAIQNLVESSRYNASGTPGSCSNFQRSIKIADDAITQFEKYFETLSPQLSGKDKELLFSIKSDFADVRHSIYQTSGAMLVRYTKFKLQFATQLIDHLRTKEDEVSFKKLTEQAQRLQAKLIQFHTTHFWNLINNSSIILTVIGIGLCFFGRIANALIPSNEVYGTLFYLLGIPILAFGIIGFIIFKVQEYGRNTTLTVRYLEELQSQMDKLRFQFDDLKAQVVEDTPHEQMQHELNIIINSIKELKLLCFP